ncbi:hypothetical protein F5879DRAFT_992659 [Lentinula edodes]|nr:hypothetical protein F5879DRAFT_992659 [Lentinula edodes]
MSTLRVQYLRDLFFLASTCRRYHRLITCYLSTQYRLDRFLLNFFNTDEFTTLNGYMARGLVISGDGAKRFLLREMHSLTLTLHAPLTDCEQITQWLLIIRYTYLPQHNHLSCLKSDIARTKIYLTSHHDTDPECRTWFFTRRNCSVKFIAAEHTIVADILNGTSWTSMMNIITHSHLYCLFPKSTLVDHSDYFICPIVKQTADPSQRDVVRQFRQRRNEHSLLPPLDQVLSPDGELSFQTKRSFGDAKCLTIPTYIAKRLRSLATSTEDGIRSHQWKIVYHVNWMSMSFEVVINQSTSAAYCVTLDNANSIQIPPTADITSVSQHHSNIISQLLQTIIRPSLPITPSVNNVIDAFTLYRLFNILYRVHLMNPTAVYLTRQDWDFTSGAVVALHLCVHVVLRNGHKSSFLCSLNSDLDELLYEHINLRFIWSYIKNEDDGPCKV